MADASPDLSPTLPRRLTRLAIGQAVASACPSRYSLMVFVVKAVSLAMSASEKGTFCHCPAL